MKATLFIATETARKTKVSLSDISSKIDSPISFSSQDLAKNLLKSKIIDSSKGPTGGFAIERSKASKIKLSQIVTAIDGDSIYKSCGLGFRDCNENKPCALHYKFKAIREELRVMLESTSLLDLSEDISNGITFLKQK
ncbi:MAG: Rrf2 family transcriptional regulator [Ignavibacteria bacterium]|nr:Rrf2 family transcriptional regulator [Ignavibacteria bacterium]